MKTVWKIGSHWGNQGESVLDVFLDYGCVFFGEAHSGGKTGNWHAVDRGDLFVISDGATPVAIGEALGKFQESEECGIPFRAREVATFFDGADVVVCPARIRILEEDVRGKLGSIQTQFRFCHAPGVTEKANDWWKQQEESLQTGNFDIDTRVFTLFGEKGLVSNDVKYRVPVYQRPYSWGEPELRRLLEDLRQGLNNSEPIFLGTMQLGEPVPLSPDGRRRSHDIIDGQQRLTTFLLLCIVLEIVRGEGGQTLEWARTHLRTSVNKRAAQDDLDAAWAFLERATPELLAAAPVEGESVNPYIANARLLFGLVEEFAVREDEESSSMVPPEGALAAFAGELRTYMEDRIKIVVIETRAGLSKTLKIFDAINSAGMDLGSEDLFKIHFYEHLRSRGEGEDAFERIGEVYELVAEYNRSAPGGLLSMATVLGTYQRELIAENDMNAATFSMSQERFFDQLFETVLGVRVWPDFKTFSGELTVNALRRVAEGFIAYLRACEADPELRIWRWMFWETRYGYANDFPVLALVKGVATPETLKDFTCGLVKSLVPASLYYAKHVYAGRAQLLDLLKAMWLEGFPHGGGVGAWCREKWRFEGRTLAEMAETAMDYSIAWTPKWKNLLCKLVEIAESPEKDKALFERLFHGFDIEHIQAQTDEADAARVREEWGGELDKIGNLVLLESSLNRSIRNWTDRKPEAYEQSHYVTARALKDVVGHWTKDDAVRRKKAISALVVQLLGLSRTEVQLAIHLN